MLIGIDCHHLKDQKGIERYTLNLLKFWKQERKIKFILYFEQKDNSCQLIPQSRNFEIKKLKPLFGVSSNTLFQHFVLPRAAKKDKVDILFSPSYLLPLFYGGKTAVAIHDIIYEAHPKWFKFRGLQDKILLKWVGRRSAKKANLIFTPSEFTKEEINKFYKIQPRKIIATPLAADAIFWRNKNENEIKQVKRKYGIKRNYFLFAAAIFDRRCVVKSILAFEKIAQKYPDFQYLIIGKDYTSSQKISQTAQKLNHSVQRKAVIYQDIFVNSKELTQLYKMAYATIYISLYEGFGLPIIESMACATPVICGNAAVFKEVAGKNCFWVDDPSKIDSVKEAMEKAINNKALYYKIKEHSPIKARQFSWEKCARKTLDALMNE